MAASQLSSEDYVARFSHRPRSVIESMITPDDLPPQTVYRSGDSSLGLLDTLPLEVLWMIFDKSDVQSLVHISMTSLRGMAYIESISKYQDLRKHAPHALVALGRTGLLGYHPLCDLYAALRSDRCVSCSAAFGAFLLMLTCQRCCYECLFWNTSLRAIPISIARQCLELVPSQLADLPKLHSLPDEYWIGWRIKVKARYRLVSVRDVNLRALQVHGSDYLQERLNSRKNMRSHRVNTWNAIYRAPLQSFGQDPLTIPGSTASRPTMPQTFRGDLNKWGGMASIVFPSLTASGALESGLWCRGCEWSAGGRGRGGVCSKAWTTAEFVQHARQCRGVKELQLKDASEGS